MRDITEHMFSDRDGNVVDEVKLRVVYVPPPKPPSPVREGSEEGSSPRHSLSDGSNLNYQEVRSANITAWFNSQEVRSASIIAWFISLFTLK